jgi:hypothetical protein
MARVLERNQSQRTIESLEKVGDNGVARGRGRFSGRLPVNVCLHNAICVCLYLSLVLVVSYANRCRPRTLSSVSAPAHRRRDTTSFRPSRTA